MAEECLKIHEMTHGWDDTPALFRNFSATLYRGEITALVGLSGCGKSTLLKIASGLLSPTSGQINTIHSQSAMVFQSPSLLPWRTALQNTTLPLELNGHFDGAEQAQEVLESVGLKGASSKLPHELSGGMQMRCAIARALVVKPDLLFLDEAFSALDALTRKEVQALFLRLHESLKFTALMVTHDIEEAIHLADRVWVLKGPMASGVREFQIDKARPRHKSWRHSSEFGDLCSQIEEAL